MCNSFSVLLGFDYPEYDKKVIGFVKDMYEKYVGNDYD